MTQEQVLEVSKIAILNDDFRRSGLGVVLTGGAQSVNDVNGLMQAVRMYDRFEEGNDPWGEHDFGRIDWNGDKVFWKIDYYNRALDEWEDPTSPECQRVMTVMLSNEY